MPAPSDSTVSSFDVLILVGLTEELEALSETLSTFPAELPTVLIAPLPGGEAPLLAEQLRRQTSRPVQLAESGTLLQPGCLYLSSPRQDELGFNRLLASVAVSLGEHALVVVVGGEAADGVAGLRALRGTGGTVLVRSPDKAEPSGLARALIEAGAADLVVAPQRLGPAISDLLNGRRLQSHLATERVHAEEALRDSEKRLRLITDAVPALISYVDAELRHRFANEYYGHWFGQVPTDLQGQHLREFLGEAAFDRLLPYIQAALAGQRQSFEAQVPFRKGGTRHVQTEFVPDVRPDGSVAGYYSLVVDISERRQADQALRRSEKKYRTLFETMGQGYTLSELVRDETGRATDILLLEANPAYERLMGISVEAARGRRIYDLFPEVDRWWLDSYDRIVRAGRPERLESRYNDLGGWFEAWVYPQGHDRFIALFEEITERKQREEQQAFFLKLSDALRPLADPVQIQHTAMKVVGAHLKVSRAFYGEMQDDDDTLVIGPGYAQGTFPLEMHVRFSDFGSEVAAYYGRGQTVVMNDVNDHPLANAVARAEFAVIECRAAVGVPLLKQGRVQAILSLHQTVPRQWTEVEIALLEEAAERTWAAVERARAEEAVRFSETRFSALANFVPDLLWASEPDGLTTWYNQRWLGYTGQTFEQATGWGWTDRVHPEDREASERRYQEAVAAGVPLRQEHRLRRHDGEYRWFVVTSFPLRDERGQVVKIYGAATDIHDLRTLNTTLEERVDERTRRLADLNAELGTLITRTAHNLEAPARQLGHLLGPDTADGSPALWEHAYDPVALKDEVARLRGVAQDLRQLSVIEEQPLDKEPLPLGELFTEVSTTPPGDQVTWSIQALPIVRGNRALLRQALDVLMTFTLSPTRGTRYVTVSSRQIEGEVQVTVQDDGLGLDGEEAATLFDLAVRTEHSVPVLEGSGLIQVRRILARHGGWAWAESQLSSGKIVLAFPRDEEVADLESLFRGDKPGMS